MYSRSNTRLEFQGQSLSREYDASRTSPRFADQYANRDRENHREGRLTESRPGPYTIVVRLETMSQLQTSGTPVKSLALLFGLAATLAAQTSLNRYAVVLTDPPLAADVKSAKDLRNAAAQDRERKIASAQTQVREALSDRKVLTTGSMQTLLNAVFVVATEEQAVELRQLSGVTAVYQVRRFKRHLYTALDAMNVPAAWSSVGGQQSAGTGVKI